MRPRPGPALLALLAALALACPALGQMQDLGASCPSQSTIADFPERDRLPQSITPESQWGDPALVGRMGPSPARYPAPEVPQECRAEVWKRVRILAVAQRYAGLPYRHHHVPGWKGPDGAGLDSSNFTAWVYNFGLGIFFTADVVRQSDGPEAPGRRLGRGEPLLPGDLLFILDREKRQVVHAAIYLDEGHVIDARGEGVQVRPFDGWYKSHLSHARRLIE